MEGLNGPRRPQPNGNLAPQRPGPNGNHSPGPTPEPLRANRDRAAMERAERFEDEKRRINASVFWKTDAKGGLLESYITHIRVEEDAMYPQSPPPLDAQKEYKKARVVVVAVKNSGRVQMHKARENDDGSFQIGKTWALDELSAIEIFSSMAPKGPEGMERSQRAGNVGFVVTMSKPYYWKANTSKEKDFFISSLVKIYRKYTGGKVPGLVGFEAREKEEILRSPPQPPPQPLNQPLAPSPSPQPPGPSPGPPQERRPTAPALSRQEPPQTQERRPAAPHTNPQPSPSPKSQHPPTQDRRSPRPRMPSDGPNVPPAPSVRSASVASSGRQRPPSPPRNRQISQGSDRSHTPQLDHQKPTPPPQSPQQSRSVTPHLRARPSHDAFARPSQSREQLLPERKRPPLENPPTPASPPKSKEDMENMPRPLQTKPSHREISRPSTPKDAPPPPSVPSEKEMPMPGSFATPTPTPPPTERRKESPAPKPLNVKSGPVNGDVPAASPPEPSATPEPLSTSQRPPSSEQTSPEKSPDSSFRPGLGPMAGKLLAKETTTSKWRKAANAAVAFKPRAGGAGARLLASKNESKESNEPDGVTEVVPAPSAARNLSSDRIPPLATSRTSQEQNQDVGANYEAPQVSVTSPETPKPRIPAAENPADATAVRDRSLSSADNITPAPLKLSHEEIYRNQRHEELNKYASALDIDPSVLDNRGLDYDIVVSKLGWSDDVLNPKTLEKIKGSLQKDVNNFAAGSWLKHSGQEDHRVYEFERFLNKAISECDEMEGFLTMYGAKLSTLNDDVAYIEAQASGLQVQTANRKMLQTEIQNRMHSNSLDSGEYR
ncbi:MAG: hypothetical protein M1831_003642 [Alyxoria varia]|nr:MAG: hypothetical protein M1831_003642 [Alyxoria varia]